MTKGWTGKLCPRCHGSGREYRGPDEGTQKCEACDGTGEEYGDIQDGGPTPIEEPPSR